MSDPQVQGTISRLGFLEDGIYKKEPDCFDGLRDLIRFLHNDTGELTARRTCASHNVVKHDLVPIMKADDSSEELFDASLRLVVNLCQPTEVVLETRRFADEKDDNKTKIYCELESGLLLSLSAFVDPKFFEVLAAKLKAFFDLKPDERGEKKRILVERIIVLLRYILAIGYDTAKYAQVEDVNCRTQEAVIRAFLQSDIPNILFGVICTNREREFSLHFLSIFALAVKPFSGTKVAAVGEETERILQEKENEERKLRLSSSLSHLNLKQKAASRPSGRSFLGGIYEVKGKNAINPQNPFIVKKPLEETDSLLTGVSHTKSSNVIPKRKTMSNFVENSLETGNITSSVTLYALKKFTSKFIDICFNQLMKQSKDQAFLSNLSLSHKHTEIHFFIVVEFVMEYARVARIPFKQISQTFSKEFFHTILDKIGQYFDLIKTDKENANTYALKAQHAISAYKQMITFLNYLDSESSEEAKEYYQLICHYIFEVQEYREMGYTFLTSLSPGACSRKLLEDLVITNHFYLHIMERQVKRGELTKVTEKKKARKKRKIQKKDGGEAKDAAELPLEQAQAFAYAKNYDASVLNVIWDDIAPDLSHIINSENNFEQVSVLDILISGDDDDLKGFAFLKIQRALREKRVQDAYNLYRSARMMWFDGDFGTDDTSSEEEFNELKSIFNTSFKDYVLKYQKITDDLFKEDEEGKENDEFEEKDADFDDLSETEQQEIMEDVQFTMDEYIGNFCNPVIVSWYTFLLKDYSQNSMELNNALLKLFHRIAFELKAPSRLYNASFLRILQRLHDEMGALPPPQQKAHIHFEFYRFGHHLLTKFFDHFEERGTILVNEVILPKSSKECYEIEHGYGTHEGKRGNLKDNLLWPQELEEELVSLHREYTNFDDKPEGLDVVDFIKANLSRQRDRGQILKKIKSLYL